MRIGLDARPASHPQAGGFKTYTENLIRALPLVDPMNHYTLYTDRPLSAPLTASNVDVRIIPVRLPAVGVILREQSTLPGLWATDRIDLAHCPKGTSPLNAPCPIVLTLHDTILWDYPPCWRGATPRSLLRRLGMRAYELSAASFAVRHARRIITCSQRSQQDIQRRFGVPAHRIVVVYEAPSPHFRVLKPSEQSLSRGTLTPGEPFVLGLCSSLPHKNTRALVAAYQRLPSALLRTHRLVLVLTHGSVAPEIAASLEKSGLANRVVYLDHVDDDELCTLYNAARLFVFPSLYEGFGLPPLEAMACGTPVVSSNRASLPEILGTAALLVDPEDCAALAGAMAQVLTDDTLRVGLAQRGFEQAARYSWERCARETVSVYESVYQRAPARQSVSRAS